MEKLSDRLVDYGYGAWSCISRTDSRIAATYQNAVPEMAQVFGRSVITGHEGWQAWQIPATADRRKLAEGLVPEVHVEVARSDFDRVDPERYEISSQEARALIENGKLDGTPLGDLFAPLRQYNGWVMSLAAAYLMGTFSSKTSHYANQLLFT